MAPRLDWRPRHDPRSLEFPIRDLVPDRLRGRSWRCDARLDQGSEGACVGFAWSHELAASPVNIHAVDDEFAREVYREARRADEWPGEEYEGTSVLAGAKVLHDRRYMDEYRWAFGIDDVCRALSHQGPVVLGLWWPESAFDPSPAGLIDTSGAYAGGHAILARGLLLKPSRRRYGTSDPCVRLRNSWGSGWGVNGDCLVRCADLERLLADDGEACVPVTRGRGA